MTITLNHTIVPARDREASARFFAEIFGLEYKGASGHFSPVQVNRDLHLLFDQSDTIAVQHLAFHVGDREFDAILQRVQDAGIGYGSQPWSRTDGKLYELRGGRGVYFEDPSGHVLEIMTVPE
jgi:catechol 2,3-dioxygenase-like lactoylglutathione lyase family enzyme